MRMLKALAYLAVGLLVTMFTAAFTVSFYLVPIVKEVVTGEQIQWFLQVWLPQFLFCLQIGCLIGGILACYLTVIIIRWDVLENRLKDLLYFVKPSVDKSRV